jgi:hypothetical protein
MDTTTRAARERLAIALRLVEDTCNELEQHLEEHTCCASDDPPRPGHENDCPLCTLYRDAYCIGYLVESQRSSVEGAFRCDLLLLTRARQKQARALLSRLTADQSAALALLNAPAPAGSPAPAGCSQTANCSPVVADNPFYRR